MKAWKQVIMQEVAQELQAVRQVYKEAIESYRHNFWVEFEGLNERLHLVKVQSTTFENEIKVLKAQKHAANQRSTQDILKIPIMPSNTRPIKESKTISENFFPLIRVIRVDLIHNPVDRISLRLGLT